MYICILHPNIPKSTRLTKKKEKAVHASSLVTKAFLCLSHNRRGMKDIQALARAAGGASASTKDNVARRNRNHTDFCTCISGRPNHCPSPSEWRP
jgi:hypothetical protein